MGFSNWKRTELCAALAAVVLWGCTGETGPQGTQGLVGPQGAPGPAGAQGPAGQDGRDGQNGQPGQDGTNGETGPQGPQGPAGQDGQDGVNGQNGQDGAPGPQGPMGPEGPQGNTGPQGPAGLGVGVTEFHGTQAMLSSGEFATAGKFFANATITGASIDANGITTVNFSVVDPRQDPPTPVTSLGAVSANVSKLVPPSAGESYTKWVPYIWRSETVSGSANANWPNPDGTVRYQGNREAAGTGASNGTLTNFGGGNYRYVFRNSVLNVSVGGNPVTYEPSRKHRISIMLGGRAGPTADAQFDFVPDGSAAAESRDIVATEACKACHGVEFHGHGGDRVSVENCVTCHVPGSADAQGGESLDLKVMIHKIHMGGELHRIAGEDGVVWDNPSTGPNEAADNGRYAIWGFGNAEHNWWKAEYPAVIENCTKCHQGSGAQVDNWKTVPSRAACGSCHENVNFATGAGHGPTNLAQSTDANCDICHPSSGTIVPPVMFPIPAAHDWTVTDPRNIPEFDIDVSISSPLNGQYFVNGEAPVVTVVFKENGVPLDHTTIVQDAAAEGCVSAPCPNRDGAFTNAGFFVHGPRARNNPVLTTKARAVVFGSGVGPFDLSASGANLVLKVDGGENIYTFDVTGGDRILAGTITVNVSSGTFVSTAAATAQEIVTWLNSNDAFRARAIAFLDQLGRPAIRSRNLGTVYAVQLQTSAVATAVFGGDVSVKTPGGSTAANQLYQATNPANNDPKVSWSVGAITYQLDPVDDLVPGTYAVNLEVTDRGRVSATNYQTPSVARLNFQVKQANVEKPVAGNCDQCHQASDGRGFILDYSRHYKIFDETAIDQCGACHDYQPQNATGATWSGSKPISRRVHGIHFGSSLNYPLSTVDYANGDPVVGRNWDITFPQDVRYCESCHPDGDTSGTWKSKPQRLACSGCHDSEPAMAHMRAQTWDPTPVDPWSGDEEESCRVCH